ncbi:MAG: HAD-IC family P-type ATPase [Clostridiales bacterium]|jgi:Cd2+/Zn2+-exporting ATPase|nr:HAD-IC family P-type ATPase [Clostridiales bacterium]
MKKEIIRLSAGGAVFVAALIVGEGNAASFWLFLVAILIVGGDVLYHAVRNIFRGKIFDENFLMALAAVGAFCIGEYPEAVAVMLFYQIGELFQRAAVDKSRKSIASLMDIRPEYANLWRGDALVKSDPAEAHEGDLILIAPGERIPLDSVVTDGASTVNTAALTGESMPRDVGLGSELLGGCVNGSGVLRARVTKEFGMSAVARILDLVENAAAKKSASEAFITKFARYYTPAVVLAAVLLAVVPPLFLGWNTFIEWLYRALTFLVVSCPCALVISIPMSFFGGLGGLSKNGILVKGGNYIEALARAETVVFDKTGTLTRGIFRVDRIINADGIEAKISSGFSDDEERDFERGRAEIDEKKNGIEAKNLLRFAAHCEGYSGHPAAAAIRREYERNGGKLDLSTVQNATELAGRGASAHVSGVEVAAGNARLMAEIGAEIPNAVRDTLEGASGTVVHIAFDGVYAGALTVSDEIKSDAGAAVEGLKALGIKHIVMLTGDLVTEAEKTAKEIGIDEVYAGLLPQDKVEKVEELFRKKSKKGKLIFVGDGVNDAPVLARADVGVAMGGLGSDAAVEAADAVIMNDAPSKLADGIRRAKRTVGIARQNIVFALGVKLVVLVLGALGITGMWLAVFADVGVAVLAILNALRALK